ncbi:hypothetical protein ACF0H5_015811 [Mactra antiquata]
MLMENTLITNSEIIKHVNKEEDVPLFQKDMPTTVIVYRLSVYISLCLTVSSLYLPEMTVQTNLRRYRNNLPLSMNREQQQQLSHRHQRSYGKDSSYTPNKRVYNKFSRMMIPHAARHKNDRIFVDTMFKLFDINNDKKIDHSEFIIVLKLLGLVSHKI